MPLWAKLLAVVLFTAVMAVASVIVHAVVSGFVDWLWDRIGGVGTWILLVIVIGSCGAYGIHGHLKAGTRPNGR